MAERLSDYSIQGWLEECPQGYLRDSVYGHFDSDQEPPELLENHVLRDEAIRVTAQLVVLERCALAASAGLINATPDESHKRFLATQTLDEARHVEIFTRRLLDLGVAKADLGAKVKDYANPHLVRFAEVLLDKVHKGDYLAGVVGQNVVLEAVSYTVFEFMHAVATHTNTKLAHMLSGAIRDERRHVDFGQAVIGELLEQRPEKRGAVEEMQREMTQNIVATLGEVFRDCPLHAHLGRLRRHAGTTRQAIELNGMDLAAASPRQLEAMIGKSVQMELKSRLRRVGLYYRAP